MTENPDAEATMIELAFPPDLSEIQATLTEFVGYGGLRMTTVQASFGVVELESVLDGSARAIEVTATSDARGYVGGDWHDGDSAERVYVERYSERGREFHGWIDKMSRRLVQAG